MLEYSSIKVAASDHAELASRLSALVAEGHTVESIIGAGGDIVAFVSRQVTAAAHAQVAPTPAPQPTPQPAPQPVAASPVSPSPMPASAPVQPAVQPAPAAPAQPAVPADWYKDPAGRFEYRYWDGQKWTTKVSRAGVMYDDPATP